MLIQDAPFNCQFNTEIFKCMAINCLKNAVVCLIIIMNGYEWIIIAGKIICVLVDIFDIDINLEFMRILNVNYFVL